MTGAEEAGRALAWVAQTLVDYTRAIDRGDAHAAVDAVGHAVVVFKGSDPLRGAEREDFYVRGLAASGAPTVHLPQPAHLTDGGGPEFRFEAPYLRYVHTSAGWSLDGIGRYQGEATRTDGAFALVSFAVVDLP